ncbi:fumarylacetoacetase [Sphingomonas sp. QA11]|uniref:fumarylacetoacetase n=1 Tax=Sphingomonas sp. QA11 TaxID=2950605 RepID=UPI00234AA46B|nr:fumarylacetoacetase [Sphingomonas sp. QA11]WCM28614.1 fumarylacetoacetase [Sphingomonas sp. QA11]
MIDETHDPKRRSWVESANGHADFPIQNLPLGIFSPVDGDPRPGTAIGDSILDLRAIAHLLAVVPGEALSGTALNDLLARSPHERRALRQRLSALLSDQQHEPTLRTHLHDAAHCQLHLPARIGDYTDFYVGIHHATNIGKLLRPDTPLLPNYKWIPIGYHGRASSIRLSGDPVVRPVGQRREPDSPSPVFGPSARLDFELELGLWVGAGNPLGEPVAIADASRHMAGISLLNDWSARDFQAWEYQPLGPFLSKNFHSTISPWIVTMEALAPFRVAQAPRPEGDPKPLPYLWDDADQASGAFAIELEVTMTSLAMRDRDVAPQRLSLSDARAMYWTAAQMVAHHTVNGCNLNPGDFLGTGTLSTDSPGGLGSLMEMTLAGKAPITLPTGEQRAFLLDGDEISFSARAETRGFVTIGFGPCRAIIVEGMGHYRSVDACDTITLL